VASKSLGTLEPVDIREQWEDEARDFTPWLASSEGLKVLGGAIGMDLELVGQERRVGPFKADILARDTGADEDHLIVIENQLEKTNHDHLGKTITYAAGLQAKTIVWVAETFTDEHRQALDWLNENAGENLAFFGLQVELWKIGNSLPAPQFKVVSSPNEWTRAVKIAPPEVTDRKLDQQHFWQELREYGISHGTHFQFRKARPQHWYDLAIGRSGFWLSLTVNSALKRVACSIYMRGPQSKHAFELLEAQKSAIESDIGQMLVWQPSAGQKGSRIAIYHSGLAIEDSEQREEAKYWLIQMAEKFHKVFAPRIQALELTGEADNGDEEDGEDNA
jgi:hypothetical protein